MFFENCRKAALALGVVCVALALMQGAAKAADEESAEPTSVARAVFQSFAKCVVSQSAYVLRPWLDMPIDSPEAAEKMNALFDYRCLFEANEGNGGTLKFKSTLIRGPIFEYLYQADFKKRKDLGSLADAPLVAYPFPITNGQKPSKYQITMEIGDCVVRAQAEGARALIATQVETVEERAALKNIAPAISQCLPAGQTIRFSASVVRSMVAEPLYRLTKAKFGLRHA